METEEPDERCCHEIRSIHFLYQTEEVIPDLHGVSLIHCFA